MVVGFGYLSGWFMCFACFLDSIYGLRVLLVVFCLIMLVCWFAVNGDLICYFVV